jgi:hypothetical protein
MDENTFYENKHQSELDAIEIKVERIKKTDEFREKITSICESILSNEPESPSVTLALRQAINVCERAHAALVDGHDKLFESIKNCTLRQMTVDSMVLMSIEHEDYIFNDALREFV